MIIPIQSIAHPAQFRIVEKPVIIHDVFLPVAKRVETHTVHFQQFSLPPGIVLDSSYFDWQDNGSLNKRIWINSDGSIHVTYMKSPDRTLIDRSMTYYYADEAAQSFISFGNIAPFRNGYGSLSGYPVSTPDVAAAAVISTHDYATFHSYVFVDSSQGAGSFSGMTTDPTDQFLWPKPSVNSDGSITMIGTARLGANHILHNVGFERAENVTSGFSRYWNYFGVPWVEWQNGDLQWPALAAGDNGIVGVTIPDMAADIHLYESTNNGISFYEEIITNAARDTVGLPALPDTLATVFLPWINVDMLYIGEEPHVIYTALQGATDPSLGLILFDYRTRILHWSPSTGIDTVVVSNFQGAVPSEPETYVYGGTNHISIDWPQIGTSPGGDTLYVVYVGFNPDDVNPESSICFGDIYSVISTDNGETWSDPVNISNPDGLYPGTDDRYPSISPVNYNTTLAPTMDLCIVYQTDATAGSYVQGEEAANWDYLMFTGVNFRSVLGIEQGKQEKSHLPRDFSLHQNYPNPFNPTTAICFDIQGVAGEKQKVDLSVYDLRGRFIINLIDTELEPGSHRVVWDGRNGTGEPVPSSVYFYRVRCGNSSVTKKMSLIR